MEMASRMRKDSAQIEHEQELPEDFEDPGKIGGCQEVLNQPIGVNGDFTHIRSADFADFGCHCKTNAKQSFQDLKAMFHEKLGSQHHGQLPEELLPGKGFAGQLVYQGNHEVNEHHHHPDGHDGVV